MHPFRLDGGVAVAPPVTVIQHIAPGSYVFVFPGGDKAATYYSFAVTEGQTTSLALPWSAWRSPEPRVPRTSADLVRTKGRPV
jgi:hypothetical protein